MLASRRLLVFACFADLFLLFRYWFFSSGARRNGKKISQWKYRYLSSNWRQVRFFRSQEGLYFLKKLNEVRVEDRLVSTCLTSQSVVLYLDFPLPTLLFLHLATLSAALSFIHPFQSSAIHHFSISFSSCHQHINCLPISILFSFNSFLLEIIEDVLAFHPTRTSFKTQHALV